jgi:polyribonucleotide nucleotidyltransferase
MELAGRRLTVETGKLAKQANGSVVVSYGDTVVLATAVASAEPREGIDFFPLTVDVEERLYAVGRIPGSWGRREGRPPEKAILTARLTDRPIRPLFPHGFRNDVQVVITVLSVDHDCSSQITGMIAASSALVVSDIPFAGPVGAVEVGLVGDELVINPTSAQSAESVMSLIVAGTADAVLMVEAGAREVPESKMLEAIVFGHEAIKGIVAFQDKIRAEAGRPKKETPLFQPDPQIVSIVQGMLEGRLNAAVRKSDKLEREAAIDELRNSILQTVLKDFPQSLQDIEETFHDALKKEVRTMITQDGIRPDGRKATEIRPIWCETGVLPRTHGSAVFTRGQTQVLSVVTLGAVGDVQELDTIGEEEFKRYLHHYNFAPFSTGEARPLRGPGRREIGHGALAERALLQVMPSEETFPYTVRVVSEVLESNGSTSMASVCGSSLSLMDAGVPVRAPVAGVAMGLIKEGDRFAVLTDIQGMEDALGDMDFKVAGTEKGVTALQMDIKIKGINREILSQALEQAHAGRMFILGKMTEVISAPRPELSPYAPRIIVMDINPDKIRDVIGPGGKMINKIIAETNTKIDIENSGRVFISSADEEGGKKAVQMIESLTREVEVGATYLGTVTRVTNFGAFVEILPGKEGLVHISDLSSERIGRVEDVANIGDSMEVLVTEIDRMGRINLKKKGVERRPIQHDRQDRGMPAPRRRPDQGRDSSFRNRERPR